MAIFFGIDSNYANSLFSSLNTNKNSNGTSGLSNLLSEYSSIQSGSYRKLLNSYYSDSGNKTNSSKVNNKNNNDISISKDSTKELKAIKEDANSLSESANSLLTKGKKSVFQMVEQKDKNGDTVKGYDVDNIYKSVKSFVDDYNNLIESTEDSNTNAIANNLRSILSSTKSNKSSLSDLGIKINSDNTLSLDEKVFKESDMSKAKSLFSGAGSYAYQVGVKASMISANATSKINRSNTYTDNGKYSYNYNSGNLYNQFF